MILDVDLMPYFQWYANLQNWNNLTAEDIRDGKQEHPYNMLSEWLDKISVVMDETAIGKEVFYSINSDHKDELTYDVWLEGCTIRKGIVTGFDDKKNIIQIDGISYYVPITSFGREGLLQLKKEYCIMSLNYDGDDIFDGHILKEHFNEDLFSVEC